MLLYFVIIIIIPDIYFIYELVNCSIYFANIVLKMIPTEILLTHISTLTALTLLILQSLHLYQFTKLWKESGKTKK